MVVGGNGVGKTKMAIQSLHLKEEFHPVEHSFMKEILVDDETCIVRLVDSIVVYPSLMDGVLTTGDGFIFMYSITSHASLKYLKGIYDQLLLAKDGQKVAVVLVGNKCDSEERRQVTPIEGLLIASTLGCPFYEVSTKFRSNLEEVLIEIVREIRKLPTTVQKKKKKLNECNLM